MAPVRNVNDPGAPVRFQRHWKGYQKGQVARFDTSTAAALVDRKIAISYRPTKAEAEEDARLAACRREALEERERLHQAAMMMAAAARQAPFPGVTK